jgi:glycosyltransferase involved in cell wall biosynthesis
LKPEISVIIPTYNRERSLLISINSVLNQTFSKWELIIVDDGSSDKTSQLIRPFLSDHRIKYYWKENSGVSGARNYGAELTESNWLIFLDSDDELNPEALYNFIEQIKTNSKCSLFIAGNLLITKNSKITKFPIKGEYYPFLSGSFCLNKKTFLRAGRYDERFHFAENTELFHRINLLNIESCYLNKISLIYHDNHFGGSKNLENVIEANLLFLEKHDDTMNNHVKYLYHQIVGVNQLRFQRFDEARKHLWKAFLIKPYKIKTLVRFGLSFLPRLSKRIYSKHIAV